MSGKPQLTVPAASRDLLESVKAFLAEVEKLAGVSVSVHVTDDVIGRLRALADEWETEAAVTDLHGDYMRSMVTQLREIIGASKTDS